MSSAYISSLTSKTMLNLRRIKEKLLELGYDTVDIDSVDFQCHPEVRTPKPVTDRSAYYFVSSPFITCINTR